MDPVKAAKIKENGKKLDDAAANKQKSIVFEPDAGNKAAGVDLLFAAVLKAMKDNPPFPAFV
jgi:hypothetical protein